MEKLVLPLIPALLGVTLLRVFLAPVRVWVKAAAHSACGFVCLWLLRAVTPFTGVAIPINPVTVLAAGFGGLPGMGALVLLELL